MRPDHFFTMHAIPKVGLIQNTPLTADFSNNLRQIVQGYRDCLDHGAELVIAPATALCGPAPHDLTKRSSFARQTQAALRALSEELGGVPLILGAWVPPCPAEDEEDEWANGADEWHSGQELILTPHLLENGEVSELENGEVLEWNELRLLVDTGNTTTPPEAEQADLIIHLRTMPWYAGSPAADAEATCWEAKTNGVPVISVHQAGCADGNIYPGGSLLCLPAGHVAARLPLFESASKCIAPGKKMRAKALPEDAEQLCTALERGIRDTVRSNGYTKVCLSLDYATSPLLAVLCVEALGRNNVLAVTTKDNTDTATQLGIRCKQLSTAPLLEQASTLLPGAPSALQARLTAAVEFSYAETEGLMYLCPLSRRELLLGHFSLYGESCGLLAPLGNLYEMDLHRLRCYLQEKYSGVFGTLCEPSVPATDRILHELADLNLGATELLHTRTCPFSENEVRQIQRKLIASALKRSQIPMVLHADRPEEQVSLPISHRLND